MNAPYFLMYLDDVAALFGVRHQSDRTERSVVEDVPVGQHFRPWLLGLNREIHLLPSHPLAWWRLLNEDARSACEAYHKELGSASRAVLCAPLQALCTRYEGLCPENARIEAVLQRLGLERLARVTTDINTLSILDAREMRKPIYDDELT